MKKLNEMLQYASEHNEFYMDMIKQYGISDPLDISQYPIITREMLQNGRKFILSSEYKINNITNRLYRLSSSGTSGIPVQTLWEPNQYAQSMLGLWRRRKKYYNISPNDRHIDFMLKYYNKLPSDTLKYKLTGNTISVSRLNLGNEDVMAELFGLMETFQPIWLQLAPSVMEFMINYCIINHKNLPCSIRYIEFMSEILTPSMRAQTRELLPNVIIANMYGSEEMNPIAYECPCGQLHIISENVFAECFNENIILPDGEGNILLTNLNNKVTPLIRYDQGDRVKISPRKTCACGYQDKIILELIGRKSSATEINGKNITTCDVSDIMLIVSNKYSHPIQKYKFVYEKDNSKLICYTVFSPSYLGWRKEIWKTIEELFVEKYGTMNMEFVLGDCDNSKYKHDLFVVK